MAFLSSADWQEYKDIINEFHEDANQEPIIWRRMTSNLHRYGEDGGETHVDTNLLGLVQYNFFRSWPINKTTTTGELDKESCMLYLNIEYLRGLGFLTADEQFAFRPAEDRFLIDGKLYKAAGDSQAAQAHDENLLLFIVLKREETDTGDLVYE